MICIAIPRLCWKAWASRKGGIPSGDLGQGDQSIGGQPVIVIAAEQMFQIDKFITCGMATGCGLCAQIYRYSRR